MTRGCHSYCRAILLSSLDAMLESQKQEQGVSAVTDGGMKRRNRWRERKRELREIPHPPYSIAENNKHIIIQRPKHLLSKHSLEKS